MGFEKEPINALFLTDKKTVIFMHLDYSLSFYSVDIPDTLCYNKPGPRLIKIQAKMVQKNTPSMLIQIQRAAEKKDLFLGYDLLTHHLYWFMVDPKKIANAPGLPPGPILPSPLPLPDEGQPTEEKKEALRQKAYIFANLFDLKVEKKMHLKRFDFFKFLGRNVLMQSEFWDCWIFTFEEDKSKKKSGS